jgi:hypothetical protein
MFSYLKSKTHFKKKPLNVITLKTKHDQYHQEKRSRRRRRRKTNFKKLNTRIGSVVQWQSTYLSCTRPWVPAPQKIKTIKIQLNMFYKSTFSYKKLRQEEHKFKDSLGYIVRPCLKKEKREEKEKIKVLLVTKSKVLFTYTNINGMQQKDLCHLFKHTNFWTPEIVT